MGQTIWCPVGLGDKGLIHLGLTNHRSPSGRGRWHQMCGSRYGFFAEGDPPSKETSVVHTDKEVLLAGLRRTLVLEKFLPLMSDLFPGRDIGLTFKIQLLRNLPFTKKVAIGHNPELHPNKGTKGKPPPQIPPATSSVAHPPTVFQPIIRPSLRALLR
ncbi:hypothetical protein NN561_019558 [Cricetulus griseus]